MQHLVTVSVLFVLAMLATAVGQPPAPTRPDDTPGTKAGTKFADDKKPANPTDAAIVAALANDPDVKMAKAKIQLAEAELAKARQAVTIKVVMLKAKIDQLKAQLVPLEEQLSLLNKMLKQGSGALSDILPVREKVEAAKAALAVAETEWKLLTGGALAGGGGAIDPPHASATFLAEWLLAGNDRERVYEEAMKSLFRSISERPVVKGPIPDRIRAALDKPVKLGAKGEKVTFDKALEVFRKEAGLDVPVRGSYPARARVDPQKPGEFQQAPIEIVAEGEELPVGAWFQLFEDNAVFPQREGAPKRFRFYVREYGLLVASGDSAPPDAPTLIEFWKQKPPAKETNPEPKK